MDRNEAEHTHITPLMIGAPLGRCSGLVTCTEAMQQSLTNVGASHVPWSEMNFQSNLPGCETLNRDCVFECINGKSVGVSWGICFSAC